MDLQPAAETLNKFEQWIILRLWVMLKLFKTNYFEVYLGLPQHLHIHIVYAELAIEVFSNITAKPHSLKMGEKRNGWSQPSAKANRTGE